VPIRIIAPNTSSIVKQPSGLAAANLRAAASTSSLQVVTATIGRYRPESPYQTDRKVRNASAVTVMVVPAYRRGFGTTHSTADDPGAVYAAIEGGGPASEYMLKGRSYRPTSSHCMTHVPAEMVYIGLPVTFRLAKSYDQAERESLK
jgi:hypothetical protein